MSDDDAGDDRHIDVGAYVCDALTPGEREAADIHLATCELCRAEVAEFAEVTAGLAEAVATPPPPDLRAAVLADIHQVRPAPPPASVTHLSERPRGPRGPRSAEARPRHRPRSRAASLLVAASLLLVAVLGGALWRQTVLDNRTVEAGQQAQRAAEAGQQRMRDLTAAPDAVLKHVDLGDAGQGTFVVSAARREGVFLGDQLANPGEGREYQVWLMHGDDPRPSVHFDATAGHEVWMAGDMKDASALAITVEPAGGSPRPTGAVIASTAL